MKVFIIAGEESGDILGGDLMASLQRRQKCEFQGIGGRHMQAQGLDSLFPMEELSIMGLTEVLPKVPHLLNRINETVKFVEEYKPNLLVTIDSPDFCFRVAKKVQSRVTFDLKKVHYVAPTVWAWRAGRALKIARLYDGILCLFPMEPPYFEVHGMKAQFIGHPIMAKISELNPNKFLRAHNIPLNNCKICVLFGSRQGEIKRMAPTYVKALSLLVKSVPELYLVVPTLPHLEERVKEYVKEIGIPYTLLTSPTEKYDAFAACDVALATSGTVGLELAAIGIPHVIGYKIGQLSAQIAKHMLTTKYVHLANVILEKCVVPEYLQSDCTPENLAEGLKRLITEESLRKEQSQAFSDLRKRISPSVGKKASDLAAEFILQRL